MAWYGAMRGNSLFLRIPLKSRECSYDCNYDSCTCRCDKFKPTFRERLRMAWMMLAWKGVQ